MDELMHLSLDGSWKLAVIKDADYASMEPPTTYEQVVAAGAIDAVVPGNFEIDLERAGLIGDPFYGMNPVKMQEYEDANVLYTRRFAYEPTAGTEPELVFQGLDTIADIYLNGELCGHTENMYIPHRLPAGNLKAGENELVVHLSPVCLEARENPVSAGSTHLPYNFEALRLRKAPHMFAWDIMPRLVSAGIYRSAGIVNRPRERICQAYLMTRRLDTARATATLELFFDLEIGREPVEEFAIRVEGRCGDSVFQAERRLWFSSGKLEIKAEGVRPWWPKGYGEANLYEVTVTLLRKGAAVESRAFKTGVRTVKLHRTSSTDMFFSGDFHFEVNGRRVFVLGTNWVPVDAYHSRDKERIPRIMELLGEIGCNAVRCWGGNIYEDPLFYTLCDEMGIMIWQDFAMACGIYPIDPEFCEVIRKESVQVVRQLRHHPSIILWSGDNECDQFVQGESGYGRDPNQNHLTRRVLPDVLYMEDPTRPYLPSSPFVGENAWQLPERNLPENHLWGPRDYYKSTFYRDSICSFASEMGYHGSPSVDSIRRFISPEKLWPWQDNDEWKVHAASPETDGRGCYIYRIELMARQIRELFGAIPDNLEDFVLASQISQAEAKKFFVELFRTGQPNRTGIIWWNLIDGWPQFSDAVVDYYYDRKLAYYYLRQSQNPLLLTFTEPHDWLLRLCAVNNAGKELAFTYTVRDYETGGEVLAGKGACGDHAVFELGALPYSQGEKKLYLIEWTCGEYSGRNHYLAGNPPFALEFYRAFLEETYSDWMPKP